MAEVRSLTLLKASRADVKRAFGKRNKEEVAKALASHFPELQEYLPRHRKPWMNEDERMGVYDALSFAMAALIPWEELKEIG